MQQSPNMSQHHSTSCRRRSQSHNHACMRTRPYAHAYARTRADTHTHTRTPTHKHDIEANHHVTDSHGRIDRQRHRRPRPRHTHTQTTRIAASQTRPYSQPHTTAHIPRATLRHADTYTPPPREGYPRARRGAAATLALTLDAIWGYYGKTVLFCGECCSFTFSSLQRLLQRLL